MDFTTKALLLLTAILGLISCKTDNCSAVENYGDGAVKIIKCLKRTSPLTYRFEEHFQNGQVKSIYNEINGKIDGTILNYYQNGVLRSKISVRNGEKSGLSHFYYPNSKKMSICKYSEDGVGHCEEYYENGSIKSTTNYFHEKREGVCKGFLEDGRISILNFCINDKTIYGRFYDYSNPKPTYTEVFDANIEILGDTSNVESQYLRFRASLPIPDSLVEGKFSFFRYGLKPLELKDSFLLNTENEIKLYYDEPALIVVKAVSNQPQILYGYVYDKVGPKVFNPFSRKITFAD